MRRLLAVAALSAAVMAALTGIGLATGLITTHGWQDISVGTQTTYCGLTLFPWAMDLYCQSG